MLSVKILEDPIFSLPSAGQSCTFSPSRMWAFWFGVDYFHLWRVQLVIRFSKDTVTRLRTELKAAERLNNLRVYKLGWCLLLIAEQRDFRAIAELLNISLKTVYNWLKSFLSRGFSWLLGHHYQGRGRKSKLSKTQKKQLYTLIEEGPEAYGFDSGVWTSAMVVEVIQREFSVTYAPRYVCTLLKSIGLTYQKAAFVSDRLEEEAHQKKRA
jgi:transposase